MGSPSSTLIPLFASVTFANESWLWVAILFALAGVAILALTYRTSPLRGPAKAFAILLKTLGLALLALALLEPVHLEELPKKHSNDVVLLADNSAGMNVDMKDSLASPGEALQEALISESAGLRPAWMERLSETFRLQNYRFDRGLSQVDDFSQLTFDENNSALVSSIENVESRFNQRPLVATVVFTDGNATDLHLLEDYVAARAESGKELPPVFPVVAGEEGAGFSDRSILNIDAATTQFEDARATLDVSVQARGEFPDPVEVYVTNEKGEELGAKAIAIPDKNEISVQPARLRLSVVPPGISYLTVGLRQVSENPVKEVTEKNNSRQVSINRGVGPFRILYISGRPNWEYKFLRRSIAQDSELDLVGLIRIAKREPKFEWRGRAGESSNPLFRGFNSDIPEETQQYDEPVLIRLNTASAEELRDGFPRSPEEMFPKYRAIIIDDVEAQFFTQEQQELIEQFVSSRGGTVIMLGGQESFQQGDWDNTPVGRILPIYLENFIAGGPSLEATYDLTREGWLEPWMRLRTAQEEERTRLSYMSSFYAINQVSAIKPGASILATVTDSEQRNIPAVVVQKYGNGKTCAVTIADMWRWGMKDSDEQSELAKSWRQILRWSVTDVPGRVEVTKEESDEGSMPTTKISVMVRDESFRPQDDADVVLTVTNLEGEKTTLTAEPSLEEPGLFTAEYLSEDEGGYRIEAIARNGEGIEIGSGEVARALNPEAREFAQIGPNPAPLQAIADATGGKLLRLSELDSLPGLLDQLQVPVMEVRKNPLWHAPWLFLLALLCFLGEWALRRKAGIL